MPKLVECVPNFSEGRDAGVINAVCAAARRTGVRVLSVEADPDFNRSVLTFVGEPDAAVSGAFETIRACAELIDMRGHRGEHPRMGACDVTPFVPIAGVTMDECADLARRLGALVAERLDIPVYLYGAAARPGRRDLALVRKGQYEGLAEKLKDPEWAPDFGPAEFRPKFGAALIGARPVLIAYNVNLASNDADAAMRIARRVRTSGCREGGRFIPGTLQAVKALGVLLKERNIAQVSMNLLDYSITNLHAAFEEVRRAADFFGQRVTGSEIVGVVPEAALIEAGRHYGQNALGAREAVAAAIDRLGLSDLMPFDPAQKVLEWVLETPEIDDPRASFGEKK